MKQEEALRLMAGIAVMAGTALGYFASPWFYLFVALAGLNLFQSAFTKRCPAMWVLERIGVGSGCCGK